jgi:hypothetical protein
LKVTKDQIGRYEKGIGLGKKGNGRLYAVSQVVGKMFDALPHAYVQSVNNKKNNF